MSNRAFRRMVEHRKNYLNYQSPTLEHYENKLQEQEEAPKEPEQEVLEIEQNKPAEPMRVQPVEKIEPSLEYDVLVYRRKINNIRGMWKNYKEKLYSMVDSELLDSELKQYHDHIEKILSEKC